MQELGAPTGRPCGKYRIEGQIGSGGFASVHAARLVDDTVGDPARADPDSTARAFALKVLNPGSDVQRLRREYLATSTLRHPNVVQSVEVFEHAGAWVLAMRRVPGRNLRDFVMARRPTQALALELTRRLGLALQWVHDHGWVHRDVKPSNVLGLPSHDGLTHDDCARICLADFGLAKETERAVGQQVTAADVVIGTPAYMPPEQLAAFDRVGPAGDQFCLAGCLWFMLVGEAPYPEGRNSATDDFPDLAMVPGVSAALADAVRRATARRPADRFPSIREFLAALPAGSIEVPTVQQLAPQPANRSKIVATDQMHAIVRIDEALTTATVTYDEAGARVVALGEATYVARLRGGAQMPLDAIPELRFPALRNGWVAFAGDRLSLCVACYQTLVTEEGGKALQAVSRPLEVATWRPRAGAQAFFSKSRGEPSHFCTVQPVGEVVVAHTKYVAFTGIELRFHRHATRDAICTLILIAG